MSEDVKPRRFEIFYSGLANTFSVRDNFHAYIMARKQENMDDEYIRLIELNPTLQLMKEIGEFLKKSEMILSYQNLTTLPIHVREPDGSISMHRPKSQIGLLYDETKVVLEKYRKFLEGVEK